jgi:diketogulonate reductase-like aldo/keto reductase
MPHHVLPGGDLIPALGQGTWHLAERRERREAEIAALRLGMDLGLTLIDTAEMYADGGAEELVGEAIAGHRDEVYLVSKVLPWNATRQGTIEACEASLRRLGTDRLDLYLLHWPGTVPLHETIDAFVELRGRGLIRDWGLSNFDVGGLAAVRELPGGRDMQTDQVLYNLARRGPELTVLPWCRDHGVPVMAYSPLEQGRILSDPAVLAVAARHRITPAQAALAWVLRQPGVCAIPKASTPEHVRENAAALAVELDDGDLAELDRSFPPPLTASPLEML